MIMSQKRLDEKGSKRRWVRATINFINEIGKWMFKSGSCYSFTKFLLAILHILHLNRDYKMHEYVNTTRHTPQPWLRCTKFDLSPKRGRKKKRWRKFVVITWFKLQKYLLNMNQQYNEYSMRWHMETALLGWCREYTIVVFALARLRDLFKNLRSFEFCQHYNQVNEPTSPHQNNLRQNTVNS